MDPTRTPAPAAPHPGRSLFLALLLWLLLPKVSRSDQSLTFEAQSWQEEDHRIRVDSQYALAEVDLTTSTHVRLMGLIDAIAGATPTGERPAAAGDPVPLAEMHDRRKAWSADISSQFRRVAVTAGFANSRESDYVSNGWSLNTVTDFNDKNTGFLAGFAGTDDTISEEKLGWTSTRSKRGSDLLVGLTQVLGPDTSMALNATFGRLRGYMSDPYKIVSTTHLDLDPGFYYTVPENRPEKRDKVSVFLGANHNIGRAHAAVDASYRFYRDTFGIVSHTLSLAWLQKIGPRVIVQPSIRVYRQSAADFYYVNLDQASIVTSYEPLLGETGTGRAPFYSSDYRLSKMQTVDAGLKLTWRIREWLQVEAAYNRYVARGLDRETPADAFSRANVFTFGIQVSR